MVELILQIAKAVMIPAILQIASDYLSNFKLIPKHNGQA